MLPTLLFWMTIVASLLVGNGVSITPAAAQTSQGLAVGAPAPDFTRPRKAPEKPFTLSSLRGSKPVVLVLYRGLF
ncbi:MAG: hypothetical protein HYY96_15000 [Candidatus Tectomicrobia bacterium]|nr:hypothetical protein [Candidatus Tectomicrobia bacterium]